MQINEVIEAPIYTLARDNILTKLKEWIPHWIYQIDMQIDQGEYHNTRKQLLAQYDQTNDSQYYNDAAEMQHQRYDVVANLLKQANRNKTSLYQDMLDSFKFMLEGMLVRTARQYLKDKLGDHLDTAGLGSWLNRNAILVDLNYTSTYKSGRPRQGGGYYQHFPAQGEFTDSRSNGISMADRSISRGIKVFTTPEALWMAACWSILHSMAREMFGDNPPDRELSSLLQDILPTYNHEVVHLEQALRKHVIGGKGSGLGGLSYTPIPGKKRPSVSRETTFNNVAQFRGGIRGKPSRLADEENTSPEEWTEYFGTDHEIEAHAAGAAAGIVHDAIRDAEASGAYQSKEVWLNQYIDNAIQELQSGWLPSNHYSLKRYWDDIRQTGYRLLKYRKHKDERDLNKINIGARKVWTIFVRKLIKHLQAYKKPLPTNNQRDPRLRTPAIPKPNLPG